MVIVLWVSHKFGCCCFPLFFLSFLSRWIWVLDLGGPWDLLFSLPNQPNNQKQFARNHHDDDDDDDDMGLGRCAPCSTTPLFYFVVP